MIDLDEIERRANAATPGMWYPTPDSTHAGERRYWACSPSTPNREQYSRDSEFMRYARGDVLALIARVRELEDHAACLEALLREKTEEADELDDERREAWAHIHEHASARSHLILKAIHGALTDALPNTPIPALDSFDVVEMVRGLAKGVKP